MKNIKKKKDLLKSPIGSDKKTVEDIKTLGSSDI